MRWPGTGYKDEDEFRTYYSGTTNSMFQHGVGIVVQKKIVQCVTNFVPVSERVMLFQLNARPANINLIQIYAPTSDHSDDEVEEMYTQISDIIKTLPKQDITIIMENFNAKVGKGKTEQHIGDFGLGERNERGDMLSNFAAEHNLIVSNTFFQQHPRKIYT